MFASFYVICAALAVSVRSEENANQASGLEENNNFLSRANSPNFFNRLLEHVNMEADPEPVNYILPKLAAKYRPNLDWRSVVDPRFYMLTDMDTNDISPEAKLRKIRSKRYNYDDDPMTLSIQAPIQTLRYVYGLKEFRKQQRQNKHLINHVRDQDVNKK